MNSKLKLLLLFFPIMIVGTLINELWVQSNVLFTINVALQKVGRR